MQILIAEDEPDMRKILRLYLEKEGYGVSVAPDGCEAFDMLCAQSFDLLIADWMMPRMDGIALCKEARSYFPQLKIIVLTAKGETRDEVAGLSAGADDYIRKPFEPAVLLLRVKKLLRAEDILSCGDVTLNQNAQSVFVGPKEIKMTQKEYLLLQTLLRNKGMTLPRELLLERVWGCGYEGDERTLDTHIRRLRSKLDRPYITTYVGVGYRMEEPHE